MWSASMEIQVVNELRSHLLLMLGEGLVVEARVKELDDKFVGGTEKEIGLSRLVNSTFMMSARNSQSLLGKFASIE
jgi:hypothetical protein